MELLIPPVSKTLTKTMIEKGNPDCFKELVRLARLLGVDFDTMTNGSKKEMPLHFTDGTSVLAPQCQNIEQAMKHVPTEASERRDRIDMLVNKVVDMKYDLQEVLDELYRMQHENEEE